MPLAPTQRPVRRRLAAAGIAIAAGASLAVAGCGGSVGSAAGASDVAGFIPSGSPLYLELSTDVAGSQWTQAIALAKRFPGYGDAVARVTKELAAGGVDFNTQVKPVLGDAAAIGVYDVSGRRDGNGHPDFVAAIDLADGKDADFVALIQSGKDPAKKIGEHDGVALYGDTDAAVAVVDGKAVISQSKDELVKAIDAHRAGDARTMAGSKRLGEAFAELPDQVLAQGFVDVGALVRIADRSAAGQAAKQLADAGVGPDAALGISVSAEADGVRVKGVGLGFGNAYGKLEPFTPKLVERVPADALAYVGLRNAYAMGEQAVKQLSGQNPEIKSALGKAGLALPLLGINLDDIKGLTSLEHALVVTRGDPAPGVVAALEVADPAKATATLDQLRKTVPALLSTAGKKIPAFKRVELAHGVTGWQSAISPKAGAVYGVDGNVAYIGTQPDAIRNVQAPASTLADDPAFQAATRQMPSKVDSIVWINGEGALAAFDNLGVLKNTPAEVIANLRPVKNLAAWSTGGDKPTFEAFLTIE